MDRRAIVVPVILTIVAFAGGCTSSEDDCNVQDARDLNQCQVAELWDPPFCQANADAKRIQAPEGYYDSEPYAAVLVRRCEAVKGGAQLACHAAVCRDAFAKYKDGPKLTVYSAFEETSGTWCGAIAEKVMPTNDCAEECEYSKIYSIKHMSVACAGTSWDSCVACGNDAVDAYVTCLEGCSVSRCGNDEKDGSESDVDCGGECQGCLEDKKCFVDSDCRSNRCEKNVCVAASCSDGRKNYLEADVDCGAYCGKPCTAGARCFAPNDCASGKCGSSRRCE